MSRLIDTEKTSLYFEKVSDIGFGSGIFYTVEKVPDTGIIDYELNIIIQFYKKKLVFSKTLFSKERSVNDG